MNFVENIPYLIMICINAEFWSILKVISAIKADE